MSDPAWLVIPKNTNGPMRITEAKLVEAPSANEAANYHYRQCVVSSVPFIDYSRIPPGQDGPTAHLPNDGQPQ